MSIAVSQAIHFYALMDPLGHEKFGVERGWPLICSTSIILAIFNKIIYVVLTGSVCGTDDEMFYLSWLNTRIILEHSFEYTAFFYMFTAILLEIGCKVISFVTFLKEKRDQSSSDNVEAQALI